MSEARGYNIVFFGSALFAEKSFEALAASRHRIVGLVTQPDRPKGRGNKVVASPLKLRAIELGIPVFQPQKAGEEDFLQQMRSIGADMFVTASYGNFLPQRLLDVPPMGTVNVHGSLLPDLRGAAPIQWAVIRGYRETGVTTMLTDIGMDSGDILLQRRRRIPEDMTYGELYEALANDGAGLLLETLDALEAGTVTPRKQDPELVTFAPIIKKTDAAIDFSRAATDIVNTVRGMNPAPVAYTYCGGSRLKVWEAAVFTGTIPEYKRSGTVFTDKRRLCVTCGEGACALLTVQGEGGKPMASADYLRGHPIPEGTVLTASPEA